MNKRVFAILKVSLLLPMATAAITPLFAQTEAKKVTVAQLEQLLAADHNRSDSAIASQLSDLVLTERASTLRLTRWQQDFHGPHTRAALMVLSDASAFLDLPAADKPSVPAPDFKSQGSIMGLALDYVGKTIPRLPNFLATRETTQIEDAALPAVANSASFLNSVHVGAIAPDDTRSPLHVAGHFNVPVAYRNGKEVTEALNSKNNKLEVAKTGLATSGEFGPILGLVLSDAVRGSIHWGHWEQGATGPEAVFVYKVPEQKSHYQVAFPFGGDLQQLTPAYHGEIAVDPATGSILRLTVLADLNSTYRQVDADILVEFGPTNIGNRSYICPLRAIAFSRLPTTANAAEAEKPSTSRRTEINDVAFTQYHVFRAASHILTEDEAKSLAAQPTPEVAETTTPTPAPETQAPTEPGPLPETASVAPPPPPPVASPVIAPPASPQPVAAADATPPPPTFTKTVLHANTNLVLLDVVVTDHDKSVHGLDQKRFHIFENGHEHPITTFTEHVSTPSPHVTPADLPPNTYSNVPVYPSTSAVNVLLIDGLNTPKLSQNDVRQQLIKYLQKLPPGTELAIFTLSSKLRMIQGFTTNTAQLLDALKHYSIGAHPGERLANDSETIQSSGAADIANSGAVSPAMMQTFIRMMQFAADAKVQDIDQRVHLTMDGLQQLARYLSAVPGRKNLIWLSGSFPLALGPTDDVPIVAQADPLKDQRSYEVEVRMTSDLLATARVAVYPVDARGVVETTAFTSGNSPKPSVTFGANGKLTNAHNIPTNETSFEHMNAAEGDAMTEIADETGGHAYLSNNDLAASVAKIIDNGSSYYTIGYAPSGKLDGNFHNLKVSVDGEHYTLNYRKGYFADDPNHPSEAAKLATRAHSPIIAATLPGSPPATQILFQAHVLPVTDPQFTGKKLEDGPAGEMTSTLKSPLRRYVADMTVDPSTVTFTQQPNGDEHVALDFALVGYDNASKRVNYIEKSVELNLNQAQFADVTADGLRVRLALDMPSAPGSLRVAIFDPTTTHAGSLEVPLTAPGN